MEEVVASTQVQECLDMEVDKVEDDANLTELKKPKKRRKPKSKSITKNKLLAKGEDTENPKTTLGAIASVDQEMIVTSPAANGDGKSSISSTNAPDKTASHDICSPAATTDQKMIVLTPADAVDGKSSISGTNAPDKTASHDILGPAAIVDQQMPVLSPATVQECLVMETDKDEVSAKLNKSQKRNRIKRNKNLESLDKREGTESPGSLGAIASVDSKMMVLTPGATVEEKSSIPSTNATDQIASGDILSTKVHEAVSGETGLGKTVTDSTTSKERKRKKKVAGDVLSAKVNEVVSGETVPSETTTNNTTPIKKKRKLETVAGDILSTTENIQSKVNAIEGSSAMEVTEAISGEMVLGKTAHPDVKMVSKEEEHTEAANGKMGSSATTNLNVNGAVNSSLTIVEILTQNLQNLKADNGETGSGTTAADTTASLKRVRVRKKKKSPLSGDILSTSENIQSKVNAIEGSSATEVTEALSGEMVLGKTAHPDVKMVSKEEEHTEAANGKMGSSATANLNVNGAVNSSLTIGEILTPQNLQNLKADNGETGSGTTAADTTASKKRVRVGKKKKSSLSGDILSTSENIQDKVNAINGLGTTKVLDTEVTNKTELSDITNHNVDGKKGPEVVNSEIGASNSKQKTKKQKVDVNPSENKEITKATLGKKLVIFDVNGLLADIVFPCPKDVEADEYSNGEAVFKRPYLDDFLSFCFEKFNVGIWSSRMKKNLDPVVDCLFGDLKKKLLFIWDASRCGKSGMRTIEDRDKCIIFKELRNIWEKNGPSWVKGTFNESNTLLLDDSPYKALLNPKHTGIFPTSYKYTDMNDDCLGPTGALRTYLEGFAAADDGRTYVEQYPFGQGPIDEMNRDWKYYSRVLKGRKLYCTSRGLTEDGKKGPEVVNSQIGASNLKQKTKKQKVDVNPSENKEITKATLGKKLVIFDVNGLLADIVHPRPKDVEADKYSRGKAVFKRPYLDDFLSFCFEKFNVGIWSSRMKKNLDPVVDCLFGDLKKKLLFIWDASHCRNSGMRTLEDCDKCIVFKELRKIWEKSGRSWVKGTFNESNTLLLDDSPYKALLNPKHTGIFPTSYKYTNTNDDCLGPTGALRAYLEGFAAADDGRTYVEQNPFGQGPIDEMNRDWNYYSRVLKSQKEYCTSQGLTIQM